jgi:NADH dehydrogenase
MKKLVITGANGYIGCKFFRTALRKNYSLISLGRKLGTIEPNIFYKNWSLGNRLPENIELAGSYAIHFAHDWSQDDTNSSLYKNINLSGTIELAKNLKNKGCKRFIFISTLSAHDKAVNQYGKVKYETEKKLLQSFNDDYVVVLKVGAVYGGKDGLYGQLLKIVKKSRFLPLIGGNVPIQAIALGELMDGIFQAIEKEHLKKKIYILASNDSICFHQYLRFIRKSIDGGRLFFFNIPVFVALFICDISALIPVVPTIRRERVYGLINSREQESMESLRDLGLSLKPISEEILNSSYVRRRILIKEFMAISKYIGANLTPQNTRYLIRAIEINSDPLPLHFPSFFYFLPITLRLMERSNLFMKRVAITTRYSHNLRALGSGGWLIALCHTALDIFLFPLSFLYQIFK